MFRRTALLTAAMALLAAAQQIPRPAPPFTVNLNGGRKVQLSEYRGKAVILGFILTTCSHCQATTQILSRLQAEYAPRGLQVVESAIDQGGERLVPGFIGAYNPPFPVGYNEFGGAQEFMQHSPMKIMHMPGLVFIDRKGNIIAQIEGDSDEMVEGVQEKNLRARIEKMVAAPAAPAKKSPAKK